MIDKTIPTPNTKSLTDIYRIQEKLVANLAKIAGNLPVNHELSSIHYDAGEVLTQLGRMVGSSSGMIARGKITDYNIQKQEITRARERFVLSVLKRRKTPMSSGDIAKMKPSLFTNSDAIYTPLKNLVRDKKIRKIGANRYGKYEFVR